MLRVAVTGVGIVSCLGCDRETVARALYEGRSGIRVDSARTALGFSSPLTAAISFDASRVLSKKQRKTMPEFALQAYAAARDALLQADLEPEALQNPQSGMIFGCDSSALAAVEQVERLRACQDTRLLGSGHVFRGMTSTITMNFNTIFKMQGACWTISSACSSGGHAVGQAAELIASGRQERMLCGGAQEINWQSVCSFDALGAFSACTDPAKASRPFDASRDGLVPGGGAAALLLERYDLAQKRGAPILGEICGYGFSSDGGSLSVPGTKGLAQAMRMALQQARLTPKDISYISAHATSTPAGDAAEAVNLWEVFGADMPYVASSKSMTGHELWMSGASQVVYGLLMGEKGFMAPNINFTEGDTQTARLNILTVTRDERPRRILCNSAGFGGTNSCLVLGIPV